MYIDDLKSAYNEAGNFANRILCELDADRVKQQFPEARKIICLHNEVERSLFASTFFEEARSDMSGAVKSMADMIEEAWKLIDKIRDGNLPIPYDRLLKALVTLDAYHEGKPAIDEKERSVLAKFYRIFREDLVVGESYLLHATQMSDEPVAFIYHGPTAEDNSSRSEPTSFWMEVGGKNQKWFYADAGLEAYDKNSKNPWWHKSNWVSFTEVNKERLSGLIEKINQELYEDDDGCFDDAVENLP